METANRNYYQKYCAESEWVCGVNRDGGRWGGGGDKCLDTQCLHIHTRNEYTLIFTQNEYTLIFTIIQHIHNYRHTMCTLTVSTLNSNITAMWTAGAGRGRTATVEDAVLLSVTLNVVQQYDPCCLCPIQRGTLIAGYKWTSDTKTHTHTHTWSCNCRSYDKQSFLLGDQFTHTHTHTHKHTYRHLIHTDTPTHIQDRHIHTLSLSLSLSLSHTHTHVWWPSMPYPSPKADRQTTSVLSCDQYPSHTVDHTPS